MRLECSLSIASTRRSKKRRRSEPAPMNSPSIAGVSHTMRIWSPNAAAEFTGSRSMRQRRLTGLSARGGSRPVPSVAKPKAPSTCADTAQEPSPWLSATSSSVARRKPRPGDRNEIASMQLVLPAPFGPTSATMSAAVSSPAAR